jgi:hypothetical protein
LKGEPELATLVATIIGKWAHVEHQLAILMVHMLGANQSPAIAMFSALTSSMNQLIALKAAARAKLTGDDLDAFSAVVKVADSVGKQRHKLAHWLWGRSKDVPGALLLANPESFFERHVELERVALMGGLYGVGAKGVDPMEFMRKLGFDHSSILVYRKGDLERLLRDMSEGLSCVSLFNVNVDPHWTGTRDEVFRRLSKLRLFQEALAQIHQKKRQPTPDE